MKARGILLLLLAVYTLTSGAQEPISYKFQAKISQPSAVSNSASRIASLASTGSSLIGGAPDFSSPFDQTGSARPLDLEPIPGSCSSASQTLCYDYKSGRTVFKPMREMLPRIGGLQREDITIHRDKITVHYSFK